MSPPATTSSAEKKSKRQKIDLSGLATQDYQRPETAVTFSRPPILKWKEDAEPGTIMVGTFLRVAPPIKPKVAKTPFLEVDFKGTKLWIPCSGTILAGMNISRARTNEAGESIEESAETTLSRVSAFMEPYVGCEMGFKYTGHVPSDKGNDTEMVEFWIVPKPSSNGTDAAPSKGKKK